MRFHTANKVEFKEWKNAKMERENNYKEFKSLDEDQPRFGAGSEFGREQRDEARRKRYGINIKKYKADNQPWLLSVGDNNGGEEKKFKGIREGGVSDNSSWYVFMQAKDGAFEAFPIEEWYKFQPIQRYKSLNAEEAEKEFERRHKIMNLFSVMYQKRLKTEEEEVDGEEGGSNKKKKTADKELKLSEMDDWMSDKDSDDEGDDLGSGDEDSNSKKKSRKKKVTTKRGGKRKKTEDGGSGTDCEEESDDMDEGAEHEYESEDSSDSEQESEEKVIKDLAGVEEDKALKKLLDSDDEDEEKKKEEEEKKDGNSQDDENSDKKNDKMSGEKHVEALKRKIMDNPDGLAPAPKKPCLVAPSALPASDNEMFEEQIRRYLVRKPMTTTEVLQKLKSKKSGYPSEKLVEIIAAMLKKINPTKQKVKGKMYLSLKSING